MEKTDDPNDLLRALPSVDSVLKSEIGRSMAKELGAAKLSAFARRVTDELRNELLANPREVVTGSNGRDELRRNLLIEAQRRLSELNRREKATGLTRVINATGVILHTNLGRAPLSANARRAIEMASGYCSLEYDVEAGERGRRGGQAAGFLPTM